MFYLADDEILPEVSLDNEESDDPVGLQGVVPGSLPVDWLRVPLAPNHLLRQIFYDDHFIMRIAQLFLQVGLSNKLPSQSETGICIFVSKSILNNSNQISHAYQYRKFLLFIFLLNLLWGRNKCCNYISRLLKNLFSNFKFCLHIFFNRHSPFSLSFPLKTYNIDISVSIFFLNFANNLLDIRCEPKWLPSGSWPPSRCRRSGWGWTCSAWSWTSGTDAALPAESNQNRL